MKISLKQASGLISFLLICGLLTSCGGNQAEAALKANCDRIFKNLNEMRTVSPVSDYADEGNVARLLGEKTRKANETKILAKYPFLDEIVVGKEKNKQSIDSNFYAGAIFLIEQALIGTDIEFPYTSEEMKVIAAKENGSRDIVEPLGTKIFGDFMELKEHQGCALIDQKKENISSENNTSVWFSRVRDLYIDLAKALQAIRNCEVSGWHKSDKCAKTDFVSGPDTYTPSTEMTDEERAILEERGLTAEREAQNSPSTGANSDVSPGQGCTKFGDVIQTQRYGQLTCKLVWLNKIRALFWMRS
jgi:hypothetical protein